MLVLATLVGACGTSFEFDTVAAPAATTTSPADAAATDIRPGDCFVAEELRFVGGTPVACTEPHVAEVFAVTRRTEPVDAPWPGLEVVQRQASDFCNDAFGQQFGVAGQISVLDVLFFRPQESTWASGDRGIACFVRFPEPTTDQLADLDPLRAFGLASTFGLLAGDCIASPSLVDDVAVELVDCAEPHWFEVYASNPMIEGPYPGDAVVLDVADATCRTTFADFVGIERDDSALAVERLFPTEQTWTAWNDRLISCVLSADEQITGSLRDAQR